MTAKNPVPVKQSPPATPVAVAPAEAAPVSASAEGTPLLAEVQSFIQRREELAKKLADEITATEAKLAELKKTAAALFPENARPAPAESKEKKVKKLPKAKPISAKTEVSTVPNPITEAAPAASETAS